MGQVSFRKIVILCLCFVLTSFFIYRTPTSTVVEKEIPLSQALLNIEGWAECGSTPLDPRIIKALKLDDYLNNSYSTRQETIFLFIGYYLTTQKIGAAHDPLVCFPGQGWVASNTQKGKFILNSETNESISYTTMTVKRGLKKELIIYWFQSYDRTNSDTFSQKITSLQQKIFHKREDNAFVRLSIAVGEKPLSAYHEIIFQFIKAFYPIFLNYIKS